MTPRVWFILGLRLFGVWQLIYAVTDAFTTFTIIQRFYQPGTGGAGFYMSLTFMHFFLALWLLKFAPQTARFFYPETKSSEDPSGKKPPGSSTPTI